MANEVINQDGYVETKRNRRMTVDWNGAVIVYASKIAKYGFMVGVGLGLMATIGNVYPQSRPDWVKAFVLVVASGLVMSGFFAALAVFVKDAIFPYTRPVETVRTLPAMGAPGNMKPAPLMGIVDGSIHYGKVKLNPQQQLALANAVIREGHDLISQRKLAEWGVVATKESVEARQLKADFVWCGLGVAADNDQIKVTSAFDAWVAGKFPALANIPPSPN